MKKISLSINAWSPVSLVLAFLLAGCNNLLDLTSPDVVGEEDIFTTADGLRNARTGMYHSLQNYNYYGGNFQLLTEAYTDNATTGGYQVPELIELAARQVTPDNNFFSDCYNAIYSAIYAANKIIENIDLVPDLEQEEADQTLGEALFIRALGHFDLLRTWGEHWDKNSEYGISVVISTDDPGKPIARSTVAQSYEQIISDLTMAIELLQTDNGNAYISANAAKGLLARVLLFAGDFENAAALASSVIESGAFTLFLPDEVTKIYSDRLTPESVFELKFEQSNPSNFNALTYSREDALRVDVYFLASGNLNIFFSDRLSDKRLQLLDFQNNDVSIEPDGRTQKYRGEITRDNSAYIIRLAEMYLIKAESLGRNDGLETLNTLRISRGLDPLTPSDVTDDATYALLIEDERRAELNMEGHRLGDLARTGRITDLLGADALPLLPIPQREIAATNGIVIQNPGY